MLERLLVVVITLFRQCSNSYMDTIYEQKWPIHLKFPIQDALNISTSLDINASIIHFQQ